MIWKSEELLPIIAKLTRSYTSNESTSITYEKARQLMEAVCYCIDELSQGEEKSIVSTEQITAMDAYQLGYECVKNKVKRALDLYQTVIEEFIYFHNEALYDTVVKGMPSFFLHYDPKYEPQNTILTLDYETIKKVENLSGIDAIYQYLIYISLEQKFLHAFTHEYVVECLESYHTDYQELFINLASVVLRYTIRQFSGEDFEKNIKKERTQMVDWMSGILRDIIEIRFENDEVLYQYLQYDLEEYSYWLTEMDS